MKLLFCGLLISVVMHASVAANTPCSGSKGGIAKCIGETFVCNDGSISASKKKCSMDTSHHLRPLLQREDAEVNTDGACSCRSGVYCTGPRGGQYCLSDSGKKSYRRR